jgi:hypothetical protein
MTPRFSSFQLTRLARAAEANVGHAVLQSAAGYAAPARKATRVRVVRDGINIPAWRDKSTNGNL